MVSILDEIELAMDAFDVGLIDSDDIFNKFSSVIMKYEKIIAQFCVFWKNSDIVDAALQDVVSEPTKKKSWWSSLPYQPYKDIAEFKDDYIEISKHEKLNMVDLYIMTQRLKQSEQDLVMSVKAYIKIRAKFVSFINTHIYHIDPPSYDQALKNVTASELTKDQDKMIEYAKNY